MMPDGPLVGSRAPQFELRGIDPVELQERAYSLAEFEGVWLCLVFYPRDFSLICPTELSSLSQALEQFRERGCAILGISTDSLESHLRWLTTPRDQGGLTGLKFPLLADPTGEFSTKFGVYVEKRKLALRGLFFIDPNGVVQYAVVHNTSVGRKTEEILRVLEAVQSGGLCAEGWQTGQALIDPEKTLLPGSQLGHFLIQKVLGVGSFGTVFLAYDQKLARNVAIKVLRKGDQDENAANAILNEARAAAGLIHPNVCTIFSVDESEGFPMIVMEYIEGPSLREVLKQGALQPVRALRIFRQILSAIGDAHAAGIIHGDLKPENILLKEDDTVKLADFGLARPLPSANDAKDTPTVLLSPRGVGIQGTPAYLSPEQAQGSPSTPQSDLFACGLILLEMLTGKKAVEGTNLLQTLHEIAQWEMPASTAELPPPVQQVLARLLDPDPNHREVTPPQLRELFSLADLV